MMNEHQTEIEAIKNAIESYAISGNSPIVLCVETVQWLQSVYEATGDTKCLEAAKLVMKAYFQLGLPYDKAKEIFEQILQEQEKEKYEIASPYREYKIKPTISNIEAVIGNVNMRRNGKLRSEIARDISYRVKNQIQGKKFYEIPELGPVIELLILEDQAFLFAFNNGKIVTFIEKEGNK